MSPLVRVIIYYVCGILEKSFFIFTYLAASGLSCGMQDLVPNPGLNPGPLTGSAESQPLDYQGHPLEKSEERIRKSDMVRSDIRKNFHQINCN